MKDIEKHKVNRLGLAKNSLARINQNDNDDNSKVGETEVLEIDIVDKLEDGSNNDGNYTNKEVTLQKGIIYGKTYKFKIKKYTNGIPKDKSVIKWLIKYHSPSTSHNKWVEKKLSITGDYVSITFNEKDMCGRFVYIRAYIFNHRLEGELKLWKHNRFRWFDRETLEDEIKSRTDENEPWLINQSGTSLCGMACVFYLFAKEQPERYAKFSKELFRTGEAKLNNYNVRPSNDLLEKKINKNGYPIDTDNMPLVDFVTLAGTRNSDNSKYKGGNEQFQAINWPPLMVELLEKLLGYKSVSTKGVYNPIKKPSNYHKSSIMKIIDDINQQIIDGFRIILMIDSDLIQDVWDYESADYHWVVLETPIYLVNNLNSDGQTFYTLNFKVYSWGSKDDYLKNPITVEHFINNYYGYIKVK